MRAARDLYMLPEEAERHYNAAYSKSMSHGLLFELMAECGLRITEAISLEYPDFDLLNHRVSVFSLLKGYCQPEHYIRCPHEPYCPKVPYNASADDLRITEHLSYKFKKYFIYISAMTPEGKYLQTGRVWPVTRMGAWKWFKRYVYSAGLNHNYSPQSLRNQHGIAVAEITGDVKKVTRRLRFSRKQIAERYINLVNEIQEGK